MMTPIRTYVIHLGCESPLSGFVVSLMLAVILFQDRRYPLGVYHGLIGNLGRILGLHTTTMGRFKDCEGLNGEFTSVKGFSNKTQNQPC